MDPTLVTPSRSDLARTQSGGFRGRRFGAHRDGVPGEPLQLGKGPRRTWLVVGSLFALATLVFGTINTISVLAHERHTEVHAVDAKGIRILRVDSDSGNVTVVGADVETINVEARVSDGLWDASYKRKAIADRYEIQVGCQAFANIWCGVNLRIVVPRNLQVQIRTGSGDIDVSNLTNVVEATTDHGSVTADSLSGSVSMISDNGSIRATRLRSQSVEAVSDNGSVKVEFEQAPKAVVAKSDNGSVDVAVPRDETTYAVDVASNNGSETTAVRTDPLSDRTIEARSDNGSVTVRYTS